MPSLIPNIPPSNFLILEHCDVIFFGKEVSNEQIKLTMFDMNLLKVSKNDGFHALLFQNQQDSIAEVVCKWIQKVFDWHLIDLELDDKLIILLLKVMNPEGFGQFRPISLCSILYKLVIKIIYNRFNVVFPKIIAPEQAKFITGKNITYNFIVA